MDKKVTYGLLAWIIVPMLIMFITVGIGLQLPIGIGIVIVVFASASYLIGYSALQLYELKRRATLLDFWAEITAQGKIISEKTAYKLSRECFGDYNPLGTEWKVLALLLLVFGFKEAIAVLPGFAWLAFPVATGPAWSGYLQMVLYVLTGAAIASSDREFLFLHYPNHYLNHFITSRYCSGNDMAEKCENPESYQQIVEISSLAGMEHKQLLKRRIEVYGVFHHYEKTPYFENEKVWDLLFKNAYKELKERLIPQYSHG